MTQRFTFSSDIIQPVIFARNAQAMVRRFLSLRFSGLLAEDATLNANMSDGGTTINLPSWKELSGVSSPLTQGVDMDVEMITDQKEVATKLWQQKAWGAADLAAYAKGDNPLDEAQRQAALWQVEDMQTSLMHIIEGSFEADDMDDLIVDLTATSNPIISQKSLVKAQYTAGGVLADRMAFLICHPLVTAHFTTLELMNDRTEATGLLPSLKIGLQVVDNPNLPFDAATGTFKSYLAVPGSIAYGQGSPVGQVPVEFDRNGLRNQSALIYRPAHSMHPRGMSWTGATAVVTANKETPNNNELANGAYWKRVYDAKFMGMVQIIHQIDPDIF